MISYTLPTIGEAEEAVKGMEELGDLLGANFRANIDWADVIERAQQMLNLSGSGGRCGTIFVPDLYPLTRTLRLDAHVTLQGSTRAFHHRGTSCGFYAEADFDGEVMLKWKKANERVGNFSNFNAGIRNIHVEAKQDVSCVDFRGAQQSAGIDNLVCRGFGEGGTGLVLRGDTYSVRDVFIDATIGGQSQRPRFGADGIRMPERTQGLLLQNITTHNCNTGLEMSDPQSIAILSMETECTTWPVRITYNANDLRLENLQVRHTENILDIGRARWPKDFVIDVSGMMVGKETSGVIELPKGPPFRTEGKTFRLAIQRRDRTSVKVVDVKSERSS
tara:strand:- start:822 stop:1820 length:999 start_codon:yes stop_codon:yes gene_type:complete